MFKIIFVLNHVQEINYTNKVIYVKIHVQEIMLILLIIKLLIKHVMILVNIMNKKNINIVLMNVKAIIIIL